MTIDLHIHSKNCSDGNLPVKDIIKEARTRNINFLSITDHDSVACQVEAKTLALKSNIRYLSGVELNVARAFDGKHVSLDFLGYGFDIDNRKLKDKLEEVRRYRDERAEKILEKINVGFSKEGIRKLTMFDLHEIRSIADGALGRPHIAEYLMAKGIVKNKQEAFDKYLVKCNVPKYPLYLEEASKLLRDAGGVTVLAHPNDPHGTSLASLTKELCKQTDIILESILRYIDGIECWHSRSDVQTSNHYVEFSKEHRLIMTGGSDCHQKPIIMGTVKIPAFVADQF
jgi:predicted metal-dependent phosphoesterase TrpH